MSTDESKRRITRPQTELDIQRKYRGISGELGELSQVRRADILNKINSELTAASDANNGLKKFAVDYTRSKSFTKEAGISVGIPSLPTTNMSGDNLAPESYSPLFQLMNMNLPRDRVTMNAWNRVFYDTHPLVRNAINLHASYPISKINITAKDKKIQEFFAEMADRINLYDVVYNASLEFWKHGECFPFAELDEENKVWGKITILNPDYIEVNKAIIGDSTIVSLKPDAALKRIINSSNPRDIEIRNRLPDYIVNYVKKGMNIPLENFNVSHLKLLSAPYDLRGTSIIVSCYKDLMLYDKLRMSKLVQADGMINPLTLVTVGNSGEYRPTADDLAAVKNALEAGQYDKDFKLITHDGVKIERVGFSGAIVDIAADIEHINQNLYTGLMVPKSLMDQEGATYASSSIGLEVLRQRYDFFRNMMKKWLERKIFAPISELNGFFEYSGGEKRLVIPQIDFNHMNLYDMGDYIQSISQFVSDKKISRQSMYRTLGLSYEEEQFRIKEEMIADVIMAKEEQALQSMTLSELRAIDANSNIVEPTAEEQSDNAEMGISGAPMDDGMDSLPGVGGGPMGGLGAPPDLGMPGGGGEPPAAPPGM